MTRQERIEYRMREAKTVQERERERGVKLPDQPPAQGMGPGGGMGGGRC